MIDVAAVREQIDRQVRPGQSGTATVPGRTPGPGVIGTTRTTISNRYDWDEGSNHRYALYGRSRYGQDRYISIV